MIHISNTVFLFVLLYFSHRDAILTSTVNCITSFFSGFAIFSVLGYMAYKQGVKIEDVATEGTLFGHTYTFYVVYFILFTLNVTMFSCVYIQERGWCS